MDKNEILNQLNMEDNMKAQENQITSKIIRNLNLININHNF
jgi:hypothetical protein